MIDLKNIKTITKFTFDEKIYISNKATSKIHDVKEVGDDNKIIGDFIENKFGIKYVKSTSQEDMLGIDAYFDFYGNKIPFDFKSWMSDSLVLYVRDFIKNINEKGIFYFRKFKDKDTIYYAKHFYYIPPETFKEIYNAVSFLRDNEKLDLNKGYFAYRKEVLENIKTEFDKRGKTEINDFFLYFGLDNPEVSTNKYSRYNKALSNNIRLSIYLPNIKTFSI